MGMGFSGLQGIKPREYKTPRLPSDVELIEEEED